MGGSSANAVTQTPTSNASTSNQESNLLVIPSLSFFVQVSYTLYKL